MVQYQKTFSTEQDDSEDSSQGQQMKDVMMKSFGFLSSISLGILAVCFIVVVLDTNNSIKEQSQNELENQIERQAMAVLNEGGDYLIRFLNNYDQSVVSMIAQLSSNTLRRDGYSMSMEYESYFDYTNDYLAQPLSQDDRQVKDVSLSHSSYYVTGALPSDIATLASDIQTYRNLTAHLDNYFPFVYDNKESLVAAYTGYSTSTSLFRHYPGTETLTVDPNREYDPVNRPWYHDALTQWSDYHGGGAYSAPYADLFGK